MLPLTWRKNLDWCLGKSQLVTAGAVVAFGAALKAPLEKFEPIRDQLAWMQENAWWVVIAGPIVVAVMQWVRRKYGSPWAWEGIQKILDEFRAEVFSDHAQDPLDHHRVTLFRFYPRFAPGLVDPRKWFGRWLVGVARSDHLTKARIRRFRAPDDAESCEGVVGMAWRRQGWFRVPDDGQQLPVLARGALPNDVKNYAELTGVSTAWIQNQLRHGRPLAQSYAALVVLLKGQPWGVLVLDSRDHGPINLERLSKFTVYGRLLTPLLERV